LALAIFDREEGKATEHLKQDVEAKVRTVPVFRGIDEELAFLEERREFFMAQKEIHAYEHQMNGNAVQAFGVYISRDSVTLQYEYSTSCSFSGCGHIEKAVEDIGRFLKRGCDLSMEQVAERR
jgi:hypothetical protein